MRFTNLYESDMRLLHQLRAPPKQGEQDEQGGSVEDVEPELDAYILEIPAKANSVRNF